MAPNRCLLALAAGMALPSLAHGEATTQRELEQLKQDIQALKALKDQYEARLSALEVQLKAAEASNAALNQQVQQVAQTAREESRSIRALPSLTNPQLSLVLSGTYANLARHDPRAINGFWAPNDELMSHERGFSLLGSEATATARIDPYFAGTFTAHFHEEDVDVEEAFVDTTSLPAGTGIRFGRFFSALGYLNEKHAHAWNFIDDPLPYRAFLDGANFGGAGVRASWMPATPWMTELSLEAFQGDHFPAERMGNKPGSMVGAAHVGSDISTTVSWRAVAGLVIAVAWFYGRWRQGTGFYVCLAAAVTISVQLVGVYLVFASLIMPALGSRRAHHRLLAGYLIGLVGYGAGMAVSVLGNWPTGPVIVWMLAAASLAASLATRLA